MSLALWAVPPLTTIQDVLYKADGTPFDGTAFIEWKSFVAVDNSYIAAHNLTVPVVRGILRVQLVPTTNAIPPTSYRVRYNSEGRVQFEETWVVPPSTTALKLKDIRVAAPVVTPPPPSTEIQESDVVGLLADLEIRPVKGTGYGPSRAAYVGTSGALEAVSGSLSDCVRVDGTSGPCGGTGATATFVDGETPEGTVDGSNVSFTLGDVPSPSASLALYRNGLLQRQTLDYTLSGNGITFATGSVPQTGDVLLASYRVAQGGQAYTLPQVLCSSTGSATNATSPTRLGSCTIAANLLAPGDRVEVRFDYWHDGSATDFSIEVRWGATTLLARSAGAVESILTGKADAGIHGGGAQWSVQSWGTATSLAVGAGSAPDSLATPLTVDLLGSMAASTSETVALRNFTLIRHPAQANP
jgi:hypothetical protein